MDNEPVRAAAAGQSGEIRLDCDCQGSQKQTLAVNCNSGLWQCHRCGVKGNFKRNGHLETMVERVWDQAELCDRHPYLSEKSVGSYGLGVSANGELLVPLYIDDALSGIQRIFPNGDKKQVKGSRKKGAYFQVGHGDGDIICMCEGYATAASVFEATGAMVFMAVDADNLKPAAVNLKRQYPDKVFLFCADNDQDKEPDDPAYNKGWAAAQKALKAVKRGVVIMPNQPGYDYNDMHAEQGIEAVTAEIKAGILKAISEANDSTPDDNSTFSVDDKPVPLPDELAPVMPFDMDLLPDTMRPWAADICDRMQCPPDFIGAGIMAALGSLIGRKLAVRPQEKTDWTVIPNMWAVLVGRPGVLKSPAMEAILKPLKTLIAEANEEHNTVMDQYQAEALSVKLRREAAEKKARKMLEENPGADLLSVLSVDEVEVPALRRYIANDTTPASLGELLCQNQNGLLVYRDEVVSLLKSLDRDDMADGRGFYLTGWAGDSAYTFDRIGRGLNRHIPAVCLSILGSTQPGRISDYIRQAVNGGTGDDGLIQRFGLMVWPDTNGKWKDVDRYPDTKAKAESMQVFRYLNDLNPVQVGAQQDEYTDGFFLRFDPTALGLFREWRQGLEEKLRGDLHPAIESHLAKYRKLIPGLALICHLTDGGTGPIGEVATIKALAWSEYLESHVMRVYGSLTRPDITTAKAILKKIKVEKLNPEGFTVREILRPCWTGLSDKEQVEAGLEVLQNYNWLYREVEKTAGRPKEIFIINPEADL